MSHGLIRVYPKENSENTLSEVRRAPDRARVWFMPEPHVFVRPINNINYSSVTKMNGNTNNICEKGWSYIGKTHGSATFRSIDPRTCTVEFILEQFDDLEFEAISGLNASIISSQKIEYNISSEDVIQKEILFVSQSPIAGNEIHLYNPACTLQFNFQQNGEFLELECNGSVNEFTPNSAFNNDGNVNSGFFMKTVFV